MSKLKSKPLTSAKIIAERLVEVSKEIEKVGFDDKNGGQFYMILGILENKKSEKTRMIQLGNCSAAFQAEIIKYGQDELKDVISNNVSDLMDRLAKFISKNK